MISEVADYLADFEFIAPCLDIREIPGTAMLEIDPFYFYWISMFVTSIRHVHDDEDAPMYAAMPHLSAARNVLENFCTSKMQRVFPESSQKAKEIIAIIDKVLPKIPPEGRLPDWMPLEETIKLKHTIEVFGSILKTESKHRYVICVEDQRCLSAYTLIENIESCFPEAAWKIISREAKREFAESGRALSLERYTASGFHALRGVECVIRQYLVALTGSQPTKRDWGTYIQTLKSAGADPKLLAVLDNIRTLDRNPLMHPEDWLDIDDAIAIFNSSHTAITRLADGITKTQNKSATP
jgi:hypothetical protein